MINASEVESLRAAALSAGATVFELRTPGVASREAFFDAVRETLPLDPPLLGSSSWDALSDSLWEGLYSLDTRNIVIIWRDASAFRAKAPEEFKIASSVLGDVSEAIASPDATCGEPKQLSVLLA